MAEYHFARTGKETRHFAEKLAALVGLFLFLVVPQFAQAKYIIATTDGEFTAECYWIQQGSVHFCEGYKAIALKDLKSIEVREESELSSQMHREAITRFRRYTIWLHTKDCEVLKAENELAELMQYIARLIDSGKISPRFKDAKHVSATQLELLEQRVKALQQAWADLRVPDKSLLILRETKRLEHSALNLSIGEAKRFLKTGDPTHYAYFREHARQAGDFHKKFEDYFP
ncbi:MAG: hypothetical protein JW920_08040 [Deltaproteobacteria bacterium]|nr:hypothetical protein [Deltaproteobacteria bacterium]